MTDWQYLRTACTWEPLALFAVALCLPFVACVL